MRNHCSNNELLGIHSQRRIHYHSSRHYFTNLG
ncbi:MAG: hypothetical protein ACFFC7_12690 [Candidatus Hermodarchaeota archaeon]